MDEKEFHNVMGRHVLTKHGVESWNGASVAALFMRDNKTDRLLQVRIEVTYSPLVDGNPA